MEKNDDPIPKFKFNKEDLNPPNDSDAKSFNLDGKIMLCAIVLLFFIIILMLCLHIYARWYLIQSRRRRNRHRRRTQLVFFTDNPTTTTAVSSVVTSRGLEASVIASLPLFFYDPKTQPENSSECAVCLSEFESGETGRVLPKCKHSFHTECIDMWFHSHSTCPLCRAPVEPVSEFETRPEFVITVCEAETGSSSNSGPGLESENENRTGKEVCSSSVGLRRKPSFAGVTIEVPSRNELCCDSPLSTQSSFRSPISRMLSFKRILSMDWKGSLSPSSCGGIGGGGCSSVAELKVEQGGRVETQ
jgi:E3 ubiquitin-protein ligase RNF38/44